MQVFKAAGKHCETGFFKPSSQFFVPVYKAEGTTSQLLSTWTTAWRSNRSASTARSVPIMCTTNQISHHACTVTINVRFLLET